jgi:16S rRNA processing protein RimM
MSNKPSDSSARKPSGRADQDVYYIRNQAVIVPAGHLAVGQIVGAHGLNGELRVEAYSDFPDRFAPGAVLFMGEELEPVTIASTRPHKTNLLIQLEEVNNRNEAEDVRGLWLYVPQAEAAALEEGQYWIHDIIGLKVVTTDGMQLGTISDVMTTGANDVYVVRQGPGSGSAVNQGRDILLPAIADVVEQVDLEQGIMVIRLLDGLIDL